MKNGDVMKNEKKNNETILCIIPARGGSKGLPGKNLKELYGKPLIAWTIEEAKKSRYIGRIIVSTDDSEIKNVSEKFGAEVILRPTYLADDSSTTVDAIIHALNVLGESGYKPQYILLLQCTSPLRKLIHIEESIEKFLINKENVDALVSVTKIEHPPWWYKKIDKNGFIKDFIEYDHKKLTRRQDFPEVYNTNGAIYLIKTDKLFESRDFEAENTIAYVMDSLISIDIDTELDFILAETLLKINRNI